MGAEEQTSSEEAAQRILASWPQQVRAADIAALSGLSADAGGRLIDQLMNVMPSGPAGATEAARLAQIIDMLVVLGIEPGRAEVDDLRSRYDRVQSLPESVVEALQKLNRMVPTPRATPGVLGGDGQAVVFGVGADDDAGAELAADVDVDAAVGAVLAELDVDAGGVTPAPPPAAPADRFFNADIEDHDLASPLDVGTPYSIAFDIGPVRRALGATTPLVDVFAGAEDQLRELTVQIASTDFEVFGDTQRPLQLPRVGPSRGKARFDVSPRRPGTALLTATVSYQGNFITQLQLSCPVGVPGAFTATTVGRPANSAVALKPRDVGLIIRPGAGDGYDCSVTRPFTFDTVMPLTVDALDVAAASAREELTAVVMGVFDGRQPFLEGIDIPADVQQQALRKLARAGRRLYQQLFRPPDGGKDLRSIGDWLAKRVADPEILLTVQISARRVPVPWSMLYLGDIGEDDELSWDNFLGMRHIVELMPFQRMPADDDPEIESLPDLTIGLNINPAVDDAATALVAAHQRRCADVASSRANVNVVTRSNRDEVVSALADAANRDKVTYFYCHAKANDNTPDDSAIIMGAQNDKSTYATLKALNLDASDDVQLAGRPLILLNACESAELSPRFYDGFVPYFLSKGARGVIGTECKTPVLFGIHWAEALLDELLDGAQIGQALLDVRLRFLREHGNPLGLLYTSHCDASTQITPPVAATVP